MRLLSLTVRNYRIHGEISVTFDPSRNLIGGPNECGKSTLAEAAHRALFLRAKTGGSIQKEMVSTLHHGDPEVTLAFESAGATWEVEKRFAGAKGSTRLTGKGGTVLRDDEAEAKLSELLGTEGVGGRGAATQLPSLWAHLWVWQGQSGEDPSKHASTHKDTLVQRLQKDGISAVMQSAADQRAAERIAETYNELFTATGKPKSGSKPEIAKIQLTEAKAHLEKAKEAATRLTQAIDDHSRAEREIAETEAILPSLREQRSLTDKKLSQVAEIRGEQQIKLRTLEAATGHCQQLAKDDETIGKFQSQAAHSRKNLAPAEETLANLTLTEAKARTASQEANTSLRQASTTLRHARLFHDFTAAVVSSYEKAAAHQILNDRATKAGKISAELATLRANLSPLPVLTAPDLTRLRKLERNLSNAQATLAAMATGIEIIRTVDTVTLDGKPITPGESHILTDVGEIVVGDGTRLQIRPGGGSSLADSRTQLEKAKEALSSTLASFTLRDLEHASAVLEQRQSFEQQIDRLTEILNSLGGGNLTSELSNAAEELEAIQAEITRRMELLDDHLKNSTPTTITEARKQLATCKEALSSAELKEAAEQQRIEQFRKHSVEAARALQAHHEQITTARESLRDLETSIKVLEQTHGDGASREQAMIKAKEAEKEADASFVAIQKSLAILAPDTLTADLERFTRAISQQELKLREATTQLFIARDRLTLDGTSDPEADLRNALARREAANELFISEQRRAQAIAKLHQLFCSSREAIDRSLVEPLSDRITGYLQCLFGAGAEIRMNLNDSGIEGIELSRPGHPAFGFSSLSGGAKEQVAAAARLALAEILAADHDGCLPVLFDDAFAYTDPQRVQSLQRMLDLAATRGLQVIVISCSPFDYSAFGAREIQLASNQI